GKPKEHRSAAALAAEEAKNKLQLLQTQAWANACARSYCLRYGREKASAYALSNETDVLKTPTQTGQWSQWAKGQRAVTSKTVTNLAAIKTFKGPNKVHSVGPWQASPRTGVGARVPLWEVLRGDPRSAWQKVPDYVWRHWLPLEGDLDDPIGMLTRPKTYPNDDYDHYEFAWQAKKTASFREKLPFWREACREALRRFAAGETEVPEDIDDPNWAPPLVKEAKRQENEIRSLGFDFTEEPWAEELDWLLEVEDYLRAKRRGLWGGAVDEEALRQKVDRIVCYGYDSHDVYHSLWVPDAEAFKTEAGLCELLRQCVEAGAMLPLDGAGEITFISPPLVILAASITIARLTQGIPCRIGFEIEPKRWNLDESLWAPIAAELERIGLSMEAFQEAARGFGIEIYKFGRDEQMEELYQMPESPLTGKYARIMSLAKK
ncbi:MAG: hypothetical protein AB7F20_15310, partial [Geoalkalibacter sp.]|uniref:hypothetical protein n=1 Tax=Geoalkalibacter sp. TaxID=3041440 RepID=UPI003D0C249E